MENETKLPFKVGQLAEAKCFKTGFRGAWFRCKILETKRKRGGVYVLDYYDFPDDAPTTLTLYQILPDYKGKAKEKLKELMLRPCYPPIYNAKQIPHASMISEVSVIVDDSWKVGDLVDWWASECYWSGTITKLLGDGKAEIQLKPPPYGEGTVDEVELEDIRPSLDWTPEYGWTMPTPEGDSGRPSAWLLKPINQGQEIEADQGKDGSKDGSSAKMSVSYPVSSNSAFSDEVKSTGTEIHMPSLGTTVPKEPNDIKDKTTSQDCRESIKSKPADEVAEENDDISSGSLKYGASDGLTLNSIRSNTLEAAILDLEEYLNKVKWLKSILRDGLSSSDAPRYQWEFLGPLAASDIPK